MDFFNIILSFWKEFSLSLALNVLFYLAYLNYKSCSYWRKRNIPHIPAPWIFSKSSLTSFILTHKRLSEIYNYSDNKVCVGFFKFRKPTLLLKSPQAIISICNTDFKMFTYKRPEACCEGNKDPLSQHLLALGGYKWNYLRSKLTPAFTPDKLKSMFPILEKCVDNFIAEIESSLDKPIEVKDLCGRLSMDCIASCAFGLDLKCVKNENKTFIQMSSEPFRPGFWYNLKCFMRTSYPNIFKALRINAYKKDVITFYCSLVDEMVELRRKSDKPYVDFVYLLMKLLDEKEVKPEGSPIPIKPGELIASQVFSFFVGGYETTSITMGNALFELARDEVAQNKLRDEIDTVIGEDEITYDNVNSLKYLSCVIDEVLRLHPAVYCSERLNSERYQIPDTDYIIDEGTEIIIPIREIHHDPDYFPEPIKFNPDRFDATNRANIIKGTYLPFGDGPRHCIGSRFSLIELKLALSKVVKYFKFKLDPRTPSSLAFEEYSRIYKAKHDILLNFSKRVKITNSVYPAIQT